MRVICEYQAYIEPHLMNIVQAVFDRSPAARGNAQLRTEKITEDMHHVANEARTIELD